MMKIVFYSLCLACSCVLFLSNAGSGVKTVQSLCMSIDTCGKCIATGCYWCSENNYSQSRCDSETNLTRNGCAKDQIVYSRTVTTENNNTRPRDSEDGTDAVQLAPQNITIRMRPGTSTKFNVTFRQAANYPVDLYFLIDVSNSMKELTPQLVNLSDVLATSLYHLTKNYRLGLGTFMDKTTTPIVNEYWASWCKNCTIQPYAFRNYLPLTTSISSFKLEVASVKNSGNLDTPEGILDALMQAVVCMTEIGWRNQSRKLIVVSTDSIFHVSGDGLLSGIPEANDLKCYCQNDERLEYLNFRDYPSVSQLARKVFEKRFNVIFAIPDKKTDAVASYRKLVNSIEGSNVSTLTADFSNVVDLIKENYKSLSSKVILKASKADNVSVSFRSACFGNLLQETQSCDGLRIGQNVTFEVHLELLSTVCPLNKSEWKKVIYIDPVGLEEKLTVNIQLDCACPCEESKNQESYDFECSNNGFYRCGKCDCANEFYGTFCNCSKRIDDIACRSPDGSICDEHGECYCGECKCNAIPEMPGKRYSGKFCECNDYKCDYFEGELCGGVERGKCSCGSCQCSEKWSGKRCNCTKDETPCLASNNVICNGKGKCECGRCICEGHDLVYTGPKCEDCLTCRGCEEHYDCVTCRFGQNCPTNCSTQVDIVDETEYNKKTSQNEIIECSKTLDNGCSVNFLYSSSNKHIVASKTCNSKQDSIPIIIGVVTSILAVGISLLIMWKVFITIHDKREYAKFEEEKLKTCFTLGNPLYVEATTTVSNPTYASDRH